MKNSTNEVKTLGIIFDGDGDRIAAIDEKGRYSSTQDLLPYFIHYLGEIKNFCRFYARFSCKLYD